MICPNEIESGVTVAPNNIDLIVNLKYIFKISPFKVPYEWAKNKNLNSQIAYAWSDNNGNIVATNT